MYDIIGDIHGYAAPLKRMLEKLGYKKTTGSWHQPGRKVIFVGDYIDRGPEIRESLQIIKGMVDSDNAIALMGNHEYNALAYHATIGGNPLRRHSEKNTHQHRATLEQFSAFAAEWQMYLQWFYTLPLFFEDKGIRVVHACWDDDHIQWLKDHHQSRASRRNGTTAGYVTLDKNLLITSHDKSRKEYTVIEETLKGKEFDIPEKYEWSDKDGHLRNSNRTRWWVNLFENNYGNWLFNCPPEMEALTIVTDGIRPYFYPADAPPVFFGHYWMEDTTPVIQEKNVVCLDYSVAKGGSLVAYRWNGERELDTKNLVRVKYNEVSE